jgi:putative peptide zinc metalloprotease protein
MIPAGVAGDRSTATRPLEQPAAGLRPVEPVEPVAPGLRPDDVVERAPGLRLVGRYEGSGYVEDRFLAVRGDGQTVFLTPLLHHVLRHADGDNDSARIAALVGDDVGRGVGPAVLSALVLDRLVPAGLAVVVPADGGHARTPVARGDGVARADGVAGATAPTGRAPARSRAGSRGAGRRVRGTPPAAGAGLPTSDPLLALTLDRPFVGGRTVRRLARVHAPLFHPLVVAAVLALWVSGDLWLFSTGGPLTGLAAVFGTPGSVLLVLGLLLVSTLFHEIGHAAGCVYGGGRPGAIGAGLYLWMPVFWTDVTDAYRLDRSGRLRTDLGGIYFNVVFIVVATGAAWLTGWPPAVVAAVMTHGVIVQQLLPIVRMDGYYLFGDITGVPNLFSFTGAVLRGLLPGRSMSPQVRALKPAARAAVIGWVGVTVPLLVVALGWLVWSAPRFVISAWEVGSSIWTAALGAEGPLTAVLAWVTIVLVVLPFVGTAALFWRLAQRGAGLARRALADRLPRRAGATPADPTHTPDAEERPMLSAAPPPAPPDPTLGDPVTARGLSAQDLDEELMLYRPRPAPSSGWRRGVHLASGGLLRPPPSPAQRRHDALVERVRTPLGRSRRIVVMSRKGGAGKTTTSVMLGHIFATHRGDRVVALDANPDAGSLPLRVERQTDATITTMLADADRVDRYSAMRQYTSQASSRLEVVASDNDPTISQALGAHDVHRALDLLDRHYSLVLVDTGTGVLDEAIQQILREADQVVVVMPPAFDGARVAASTLDWLEEHGYRRLVRGAVAVVNAVRGEGGHVLLEEIERHFDARCSATVRIPWDRGLEAGGCVGLADLRPATRHAYLELAAAVADRFPSDGGRP